MHLLIIPDGNRRWAKLRNLLPFQGHEKGIGRFDEIVTELFNQPEVLQLTFWILSLDNIQKRSKEEIEHILDILEQYLERESTAERFVKDKIGFKVVGLWKDYFSYRARLVELITNLENNTSAFTSRYVTLLFVYDGYIEMEHGLKNLNSLELKNLNFETVHKKIWTNFLPLVDGIIRTGTEGDPHNSAGVMMWLTGYSQFVFLTTNFPDFGAKEAKQAFLEIKSRTKRLGK